MHQRSKNPSRHRLLQNLIEPVATIDKLMNTTLVFLIDELLVRKIESLF